MKAIHAPGRDGAYGSLGFGGECLAFWCDLYLAEGMAHKKPLTIKADRGRIERHIKPLLGKKKVDQVSRPGL
jgi:hypothetical protein